MNCALIVVDVDGGDLLLSIVVSFLFETLVMDIVMAGVMALLCGKKEKKKGVQLADEA